MPPQPLIDLLREHLRPGALRLLSALLDEPDVQTRLAQGTPVALPKATILDRLAAQNDRLSDDSLRQRIAELNKAARALTAAGASPPLALASSKSALTLTADPKLVTEPLSVKTRAQLDQSTQNAIDQLTPGATFLQPPRATSDTVQIFVGHAWENAQVEAIVDAFIKDLTHELEHLPHGKKHAFKIWFDRKSMPANAESFDAAAIAAAKASRIGLILLSNKWYKSQNCQAEAACFKTASGAFDFKRLVRIQQSGNLSEGDPVWTASPIHPEFFCQGAQITGPNTHSLAAFTQAYRNSPRRADFIRQIRDDILVIVDADAPPEPSSPPPTRHRDPNDLKRHIADSAARAEEHDPEVQHRTALPPRASRQEGADGSDLLPILESWARGGGGTPRRLFTLLGSFGAGKTIASQLFARHLLALRTADPAIPFPVYLDFRRLIPRLSRADTIDLPLQDIIAHTLGGTVGPIDGTTVLAILRAEPCVVIFDGLDEIGTSLGTDRTTTLFRHLLEIVPGAAWEADAKAGADYAACPIRLMATCRTHFFRTVIEQNSTLSGHDRHLARPRTSRNAMAETYYMAPFTPDQVRAFFVGSLGETKGAGLYAAIGRIPSLAELVTKPVMTRFVAELSEQLIADDRAGRPINAAVLYRHLFEKALARDGHKDTAMDTRHRRALLQDLALHLCNQNTTALPIDALETWFESYLGRTPALRILATNQNSPMKVLLAELRNASLLIRQNDDQFQFVHTSFYEYFLAEGLKAALLADRPWPLAAAAVVNAETREFLFGCVERDNDGAALQSRLAALLRSDAPASARQTALELLLAGHRAGLHWRLPDNANCSALNLQDWQIGGAAGDELRFDRADFSAATLARLSATRVRFHACRFAGAVLANARFDACRFETCTGTPHTAGTVRLHQSRIDAITRRETLRGALFILPAPAAEHSPDRRQLRVPPAQLGSLLSAVFAADGDTILTAGEDGTARLFSRAHGTEIARFEGHEGSVNSAVFAPDGRTILTAGSDGTARLFSRADATEIARFEGHEGPILSAVFAPDGHTILTAGDDGTARLFSRADATEIARFEGHEDWVRSAVFAPDGHTILTAGDDGTARLFSRADATEIACFEGHEGWVLSAVFAPDGDTILTAGRDGTARLFSRAAATEIARFEGHEGSVNSAVFAPDGRTILTAGSDGTARLFSRADATEIARFEGHEGPILSAVFAPDGHTILTAGDDGTARLFSRADATEIARFEGHEDWVRSAVFAPDGDTILTAGDDGTARLFSRADATEIARFEGHEGPILSAVFAPDGHTILTAGDDGTARLFSRADATEIARFEGHEDWVRSAVFAPDGDTILTAGDDGTARLFSRAAATEIARFEGHEGWVRSAVFAPDGDTILTTGRDGTARLFSRADTAEIARFEGHEGQILSAVFAPDGHTILTAGRDGTARLFSRADATEIARFEGHEGWVRSAVFAPDGDTILTAGDDGTARLFSRADTTEIARFEGHEGQILSAVFAPDGHTILTAGIDGTARLFSRATGKCLSQIRFIAGEHCILDGDGTVLGVGPRAWTYAYALESRPGADPLVRCPTALPINVEVTLAPPASPAAVPRPPPNKPEKNP